MKNDDKMVGVCKHKRIDIPFVAQKDSRSAGKVNKRNRYQLAASSYPFSARKKHLTR
jgi:hypothetical protein